MSGMREEALSNSPLLNPQLGSTVLSHPLVIAGFSHICTANATQPVKVLMRRMEHSVYSETREDTRKSRSDTSFTNHTESCCNIMTSYE